MAHEITTPSGLKYTDEAVGTGDSPTTGKKVKVHYTGRLTNGKKFDSSVDRGQPFEFVIGVGQVLTWCAMRWITAWRNRTCACNRANRPAAGW